MKKIQLHQFLSQTGLFASKKAIIQAIRKGEVKIDDEVVTSPVYQFKPKKRAVYWKNQLVKAVEQKTYLLFNKPEGYLSSRLTPKDLELKKQSVFDLLKNKIDEKTLKTLFCVGRLDENTSGLLILTNDGKLSYKLTQPKSQVTKTYQVTLEKPLEKEQISAIEKGVVIELEENKKVTLYQTKPCQVDLESETQLIIIISEGKKRLVRRIFQAVNNQVISLERLAIGKIDLKGLHLKKGEFVKVDLKFIEEKIK